MADAMHAAVPFPCRAWKRCLIRIYACSVRKTGRSRLPRLPTLSRRPTSENVRAAGARRLFARIARTRSFFWAARPFRSAAGPGPSMNDARTRRHVDAWPNEAFLNRAYPWFVQQAGPARASGLDGAGDVEVSERASTDAERSIPPNRRLLPDHWLVAQRVNGENALTLPPALSRPTSPCRGRRHPGDVEVRPVDLLGFAISFLHTYAQLVQAGACGSGSGHEIGRWKAEKGRLSKNPISLFMLLRSVLSGNVHQIASMHQHTSRCVGLRALPGPEDGRSLGACLRAKTQAAQAVERTSACSSTVRVAFSCLSGG